MIKRFSVLYVGQIDLDNVGADGTPADQRRYTNAQLAQAYEHAEALARHMDERGFYCMWMAEHHFQHEGYECIPNLILMGVHLAGQTRNLKFDKHQTCLLYTSPSPRDRQKSRMPSSA